MSAQKPQGHGHQDRLCPSLGSQPTLRGESRTTVGRDQDFSNELLPVPGKCHIWKILMCFSQPLPSLQWLCNAIPLDRGSAGRGEGGRWAQVDGMRGCGVRAECQEVGGVGMAEPG